MTAPFPAVLPNTNFGFVVVDGPYVVRAWCVGPPDDPSDRGVLVTGWTTDDPDVTRAAAIADHGLLRWWPADTLACDVESHVVAWFRLERSHDDHDGDGNDDDDDDDALCWMRGDERTGFRGVLFRAVVAPERRCTCPYHPELRHR